jgi:hypothetical protein
MFPWVAEDPVAAFLRANALFDRIQGPPRARMPAPLPADRTDNGGKADPPATMEPAAAGTGEDGSRAPPSGGNPVGNVELAQWAAPLPFPAPPLPPVFSPHTPENEAIVQSLLDGWHV